MAARRPMLGQVGLYAPHRHPVLLRSEVETAMDGAHASRHVRATADAGVHRWPNSRCDTPGPRCLGCTGGRPPKMCEMTGRLPTVFVIPVGIDLLHVLHDVEVVWEVPELDGLVDVARKKAE